MLYTVSGVSAQLGYKKGIEVFKYLKYIVLPIKLMKFSNLDIPRGVDLLKY